MQLRGDLDVAAAPRLPERMPVPVQPGRHVVLDLSGVPSIDLSGMQALLACQLRARQAGGTFAVACAGDAVRSAIALAGLDKMFAIYPTVAGAVQGRPGTEGPGGHDGTGDIVGLILADRARSRPQVRAVIDDHEDIVEVLREVALQPPGSPSWRRLAGEAMSLWAQLTEREAHGVLTEFALRAEEARRHRLGRQWRAFLAAWHQDRRV